jgi:hypothetical protein
MVSFRGVAMVIVGDMLGDTVRVSEVGISDLSGEEWHHNHGVPRMVADYLALIRGNGIIDPSVRHN